jgi:hypothetical protein
LEPQELRVLLEVLLAQEQLVLRERMVLRARLDTLVLRVFRE